MYINGVQFNDAETGRFSYGLIGGLNDATRNKEGIGPFEINNFTFGAIGGASNINLRPANMRPVQNSPYQVVTATISCVECILILQV